MLTDALRRFLLIETPAIKAASDAAREALERGDLVKPEPAATFAASRNGPSWLAASAFSQAATMSIGYSPRPNQITCGLLMERGAVVEMATGEGKTLAVGLACCLLARRGRSVHSVTVNGYLSARDYALLSPIYELLGLTSALLDPSMTAKQRKDAYACDIVHGSNSEFVFDWLRDGTVIDTADMVQRGHACAVVDEADSILLDEASTPLVLSDGTGSISDCAVFCDGLVSSFNEGEDYAFDVEGGGLHLTTTGTDKSEAALRGSGLLGEGRSLYDGRSDVIGYLDAALKARFLLMRDRDYIVRDQRIEIVDVNTGRVLDGRRYADGLHEAIEIKEGVPHNGSGDALSSTTYMDYFSLYSHLCGATGTALSSASEIKRLYRADTVRVPTHVPHRRQDRVDMIWETSDRRDAAVVEEAVAVHLSGRPVLVGTSSVADSLAIASLLLARGFTERTDAAPTSGTFALLNASRDEHEASVVAQAGRRHALTIATNMAGRGTDIVLGGGDHRENADMCDLGGLHVIGLGRHASRRIDDQLRGRAGRRGEPGSTVFHVSMTDPLVARHSSVDEAMLVSMCRDGKHEALRGVVDHAQKVADAAASDSREALRQFSGIDAVQSGAFNDLRREFMSSDDPAAAFAAMRRSALERAFVRLMPENSYPETWDVASLKASIMSLTAASLPIREWIDEDGTDGSVLLDRVLRFLPPVALGEKDLRETVLASFDECWRDHVAKLSVLRRAVAFRTYAMLQPVTEYRIESYTLFASLLDELNDRVSRAVSWKDKSSVSRP